MKLLLTAALLLTACATTKLDYGNPEVACPSHLTYEQKMSGTVQCRAECASWGMNIVQYDDQCRCICNRPPKVSSPSEGKTATPGQVPNTQI